MCNPLALHGSAAHPQRPCITRCNKAHIDWIIVCILASMSLVIAVRGHEVCRAAPCIAHSTQMLAAFLHYKGIKDEAWYDVSTCAPPSAWLHEAASTSIKKQL